MVRLLRASFIPLCLSASLAAVGCSDDDGDLNSEEDARRAYLGLDGSIEKALDLGMDGFNAASNANIPTQQGTGDVSGTITVDGKVDQGASDNKGLRLFVALEEYSDGVIETVDEEDIEITYYTRADALPEVDLTLRNIPDGTLEGSLLGTYDMTGSIDGVATLDLTFAGTIEDDGSGGISRVVGDTHITGYAESGGARYDIDVDI